MHAPQYKFTGTGTDVPLMEWLWKYTFPTEESYKDKEAAEVREWISWGPGRQNIGFRRDASFSIAGWTPGPGPWSFPLTYCGLQHRYDLLVKRFLANGTTTATYFGSLHLEPNLVLVNSIIRLGQRAVVGKVWDLLIMSV